MNVNTLTLTLDAEGVIRLYCPACEQPIGVDMVGLGPLSQPWELWQAHLIEAHGWTVPASA